MNADQAAQADPTLAQAVAQQIGSVARSASDGIEQAAERAGLSRRVREQPLPSLAVALGVGVVLGGGLLGLGRVLRVAFRVAAIPIVQQALLDAVGIALQAQLEDPKPAPRRNGAAASRARSARTRARAS